MMKQKISVFFKQLRKTSGLSANLVVNKLKEYNINISAKTLYGYESGLSMPNADTFVALCTIYNCDNPLYMFSDTSFQLKEISLIEKYRDLDEHGKEIVDLTIKKEWERTTAINKIQKGIHSEQLSSVNHSSSCDIYSINAAHERTDIKVTNSMRRYDNDIMDSNHF